MDQITEDIDVSGGGGPWVSWKFPKDDEDKESIISRSINSQATLKQSGAKLQEDRMVASCAFLAANTYEIPPTVLIALHEADPGQLGQELPKSNGSSDLGPMKINSNWIPEVSRRWGISPDKARKLIAADACTNVGVAAWIFKQDLGESGGNVPKALRLYSDRGGHHDEVYKQRLISLALSSASNLSPVYGPPENTQKIASISQSVTPPKDKDIPTNSAVRNLTEIVPSTPSEGSLLQDNRPENGSDPRYDHGLEAACDGPYPCRFRAVINSLDWFPVLSAIGFAAQADVGNRVNWSNVKNHHNGYVVQTGMSADGNCKKFRIARFIGQRERRGEITACRKSDGSISIN